MSIHVWPMDHPVLAAWLYTIALVAIGWAFAQRRFNARITE